MVTKDKGYKANLRISLPNFETNIIVKYDKISSKAIKEGINIIKRADDKTLCKKSYRFIDKVNPALDVTDQVNQIGNRQLVIVGDNGKIYTEDQVRDFQVIEASDGGITEVEVSAPTETTSDFEIGETRPLDSWDSYLREDDYEYEVFSDNPVALKKFADYLLANEVMGIFDFQRARTHKPMKGLIKPVFEGNCFTMVIRLTMTKYKYNHLLDITQAQKQLKATNRVSVNLSV